RPALSGARPSARSQGGAAGLQPIGHRQVPLAVPLGTGAAGARRGQRLLDRRHQPGWGGDAAQRGAVLRVELLLRSARPHHREGLGDRRRGAGLRPGPGHESRSAQHLAVPARSPAGELRGACPGIAMRTLIKNGTVVTASDSNQTDVLIEGEKIVAIGSGLTTKADQVIDAENRYVMPGAIDVHTHMELPFGGTFASDDFATGTAAAAWGGTTTIVDFAVQSYGQTLRQGLDQWHKKAQAKAHIDYGFHMIVREINDSILKEMDTLVNEGIPSFKLFMAYPGVFTLDDGASAFAETCPQYLYLSLDDLGRPGFEGAKYVCSPPLRQASHQGELWKGLLQDDLQLVATDHCPFHYKGQKEMGRGDFSKI